MHSQQNVPLGSGYDPLLYCEEPLRQRPGRARAARSRAAGPLARHAWHQQGAAPGVSLPAPRDHCP